MHAGWALWVAIVVHRTTDRLAARALAWAHVALTAVIVVGTGNHWVLDVVAGWLVVVAAYAVVRARPLRR